MSLVDSLGADDGLDGSMINLFRGPVSNDIKVESLSPNRKIRVFG